MPTAWSAGEHDVKQFSKDGVVWLRCKCGWESSELATEFFGEEEKWREVAAYHVAYAE